MKDVSSLEPFSDMGYINLYQSIKVTVFIMARYVAVLNCVCYLLLNRMLCNALV